ncbi:MAG: UDP-N-acetylmuramate--L-alanine ligase [Desulfobacula sp.]|jgi:UDP-N-acetylmuramate--alanine ligase|uniref:UDP-N-acetylmuramate--L-alanine ligase n=2 Tax=Desulfobacula sp. TaxID=2593537 RepID=UPI001DD76FDB|nr:UDP-N-acetylmuramate--L-alanine ligase [Desulfobacula sp.]MBT3483814.1 UDP-N-acetylmuramate--L-alanine ligase [Desulfobacula sp.]MBT3803002.1 UDP-N-acetylmuramate--L-alanine ligase [Desulfobacula sp.]MBT4023485.1 UDP-N-acetylmuramate--L-alanine ligase [Desulfobacula sp.]MBT4197050.1 UDP-N-acetylmuramate--L-alanine ligase [Desulfobacula sp.]
MYQKNYHIHFVGIGGIGMSGIAELLIHLGYQVSGSDLKLSPITRRLEKKGGIIFQGHSKEQVKGASVVVTSTAISSQNPEVIRAKELLIPIIPRAEMLAELMRIKYSIAVSGAHGKTSTTSMISQILNTAGLDPTVIIGGLLKGLDTNALHGKGEYIVAEADESDGSFLKYSPAIAAVTNIDLEHLDFYRDIEDIKDKFIQFINSVPFYGLAILFLDNEHIQDIIPKVKVRYTTFGMTAQSDLRAREISFMGSKSFFKVFHHEKLLGNINLNIAGKHNISNALASIAVGLELNISFKTIKKALEQIEGVKRRLEIKGEKRGITVIDDYGHHPTEIMATLTAIRESRMGKRLIVVFQPHRYTRTKGLFHEFTRSFYQADILIVLPIYAASEKKIKGIDAQSLCEGIKKHGHKEVAHAPDFNQALSMITHKVKKGDVVLTLGAGDIYTLGEELLKVL